MGDVGDFLFGSPGEPGKAYQPEVYRPPYAGAGEDLAYQLVGQLFGMPAYNPKGSGGGKPSSGGGGKPGAGKPGEGAIRAGQGRPQAAISAMPSFFSGDYESGQYDLLRDAMEKSLDVSKRSLAETMNRAGAYGAGPHAQNLREMLEEAQKQYGNQATQISIATKLQRFQEDMARRQLALQWASGQRPQQVTGGFAIPGSVGGGGLLSSLGGGEGIADIAGLF